MSNVKMIVPPLWKQAMTGVTVGFEGTYREGTYALEICEKPFDIRATLNGRPVRYADVPKTLRQVQKKYVASAEALKPTMKNVG